MAGFDMLKLLTKKNIILYLLVWLIND